MGQTVRSQGPYDRVLIPGSSPNRNGRSPGNKIEYLDDRRRAKAAKPHPDGLQYDFNFSRAQASMDRGQRMHAVRESEPVRAVPRGIGGRQHTVQPIGPRTSRQHAQTGKPAAQPGKPPQIKKSARMYPGTGQPAHSGASAPAKKPSSAPGRKKRPADARTGARKNPAPKRQQNRPQRNTVTDFHSVGADLRTKPQSAGTRQPNRKKRQPARGRGGHGRKLTPTYELKMRGEPRTRKHGAPIMEGGVFGFDMGSDAPEPRHAVSRSQMKLRIRGAISAALTIAIVFVLLTAVLAGQERLSDFSHHNAALEKSITALEEQISKLKMQVALQEDLGNIQERAAALGMTHAAGEQIQYVEMKSTDEVKETPALVISDTLSPEAPTNGLFENIAAWFSALFRGGGEAA